MEKKKLLLFVSPFSSGADACGMEKKKRWKKMGWICKSTDSTYNHRKDLVIAYSSSSRRAMDGWNSAVSSSKMTSKLWPRRRRPISAGLSVQCRSVGQQPAFLLLSLSSIFFCTDQKKNQKKHKTKLVRWYFSLSTFFLFYLIRAISRSIQLPFTRCAHHPPLSYFSFSCCTYNSGDPNVSVACVGNVQIF